MDHICYHCAAQLKIALKASKSNPRRTDRCVVCEHRGEGIKANLRKGQKGWAEMDRYDDVVRLLRDLLALIHRDGGQHTEQVGLARSVEDAVREFGNLRLSAQPRDPGDVALRTQLELVSSHIRFLALAIQQDYPKPELLMRCENARLAALAKGQEGKL